MTGREQQRLERLKSGDKAAFQQLYQTYLPMISAYVLQNSGTAEDAQDLFQETLIVLLEKINQTDFALTSSLSTYLYAIAKNRWLKKLRAEKKQQTITPLDGQVSDLDQTSTPTQDEEMANKITVWLSKVTRHCQTILKALFFYNHSLETLMVKMGWKNKHSAANQRYKCIQQFKKVQQQKTESS